MTRRRAIRSSPPADAYRFRELDWGNLEREADDMLKRLFPICRSLTGDGVRETLGQLQSTAAFDVAEIPSGTRCFDWQVPDEWNIRDAYVATLDGERLIDFHRSNLHVVGYSEPVNAEMAFDELDPHLHTLPSMPKAIPYRTSYYRRDWGFCLTHEAYKRLDRNGRFRVCIDSTLARGALTYGEAHLGGRSGREFLVSTYCCHPSLANDNLSGVVLWTLLLRELQSRATWHSYRFVIVPETIGAVAYLHRHRAAMRRVEAGLVITTVAGPGEFGYKQSFLGDHLIDRVVRRAFAEAGVTPRTYPFDVNGSDERQYSSPAFRIPTATITKDKYYEYPGYHTSLDNLSFARPENLIATLKLYLRTVENLEADRAYGSTVPQCEPMLGKRGLYPQTGGSIRQTAADRATAPGERTYVVSEGRIARGSELDAMRWLMFWGDGRTTVLEIAERTGLPLEQLNDVAARLMEHGLLEPVEAKRRGKRT